MGISEMDYAKVRRALKLSQDEIGQTLQIKLGSVPKIEKRTECMSLRRAASLGAMGGELEIIARLPDYAVRIKNFADYVSGTYARTAVRKYQSTMKGSPSSHPDFAFAGSSCPFDFAKTARNGMGVTIPNLSRTISYRPMTITAGPAA